MIHHVGEIIWIGCDTDAIFYTKNVISNNNHQPMTHFNGKTEEYAK